MEDEKPGEAHNLRVVADVVTSDGRLHALLQDTDEDETVLYYYIYNPDSATPEVPESIERIDSEAYRTSC
ncbi:MAG: hypothetical protein HZA20_11905 [Nitrospirae bacterium]|nr:hypothetical protein [Nitrospirota bacterium]